MNADPDTNSVHLDLEDLIAEAAGQPVGTRASEHLARCKDCRTEANRWIVVADGVRGVPSATPETGQPGQPRKIRPPHTRPRVPASVRRGAMLVGGAAAAAVLLGIAGYEAGVIHVQIGNTPGTATLTAVGGCTGLEEAAGTLEQTSGGSVVIETAGGQSVTVTTTASTQLDMSGALESYIVDGASVSVTGFSSDGTIAAITVHVGRAGTATIPGSVTVQGTAADASTVGFTVVTSGGTRVPVTTSDETFVVATNVSLGQLQPGAMTMALGYAGPDGTLAARGVVQPLARPVQLPPGTHINTKVNVRDCSPGSLADALGNVGSAG